MWYFTEKKIIKVSSSSSKAFIHRSDMLSGNAISARNPSPDSRADLSIPRMLVARRVPHFLPSLPAVADDGLPSERANVRAMSPARELGSAGRTSPFPSVDVVAVAAAAVGGFGGLTSGMADCGLGRIGGGAVPVAAAA